MTSLNEQQFSVKKLRNMQSGDAGFYQTFHESDTGEPLKEKYRKYPSRVYNPPSSPGSDADENGQVPWPAMHQRPVDKQITRVRDVEQYKLDQSKGIEPAGTDEQAQRYKSLYAHMAELGERAHDLPPVTVRGGTITNGHHRIAIAHELGWHSLPVEGY